MTKLDNYAFYQARYLDAVLPSGLQIVGTYAFYQCQYELKSVVIPQGCTTLGNYAFAGCLSLGDITVRRATAPTSSAQTFGNNASTWTGRNTYNKGTNRLHVPSGSTGYTAAPWSKPLCTASSCGFTRVEDAVSFASMPYQYVEFNPNGGTGGGMVRCFYGLDIGKVDVEVIAPEGKEFDGWWTLKEGGMRVDDGQAYDGAFQVVYAHWKDVE